MLFRSSTMDASGFVSEAKSKENVADNNDEKEKEEKKVSNTRPHEKARTWVVPGVNLDRMVDKDLHSVVDWVEKVVKEA